METIVLLNEASTLAKPEVTFFEPFALRTLIVPSSSLRRSSAVGCLATPPTISTGFSGAGGAMGAPSGPVFGALAFFSARSAGAADAGAAPSTATEAALTGFSFLGADFSSAMTDKDYASLALLTPT